MTSETRLSEGPVLSPPALTFKIAAEDWEFEQIHRLNYKTFVEEIPQHERNSSETLIDRFHDENTYIICLRGDLLIGMVAARANRPFSLDGKLEALDSYLPPAASICEIRLLAVENGYRSGRIFKELLATLIDYCVDSGYEIAIISGTVRQTGLFRHIGLAPFGPLVGAPEALFQPMYGMTALIKQKFDARFSSPPASPNGKAPVNLLPGPVGVAQDVREAFAGDPVSHRSPAFVEDFDRTKRSLCDLLNSRHAEIFMGSGTLANDVIAGQLSLESGPGLVLSNGEFGDRLVDHAHRARLSFDTLTEDWGNPFDRDGIEHALDQRPGTTWLWAVHCETSAGVLNDMTILREVCAERGVRLCLDCISSIGTVPVDLSDVYLASGVSGKGLGSFPGLSMVFYNHEVSEAPRALPRYLDLGLFAAKDGVPFTISSNLLYALKKALEHFGSAKVFDDIVSFSSRLRGRLNQLGFDIVAPDSHAAPAVITIALPPSTSSVDVGRRLEEAGYLLSYNSDYLRGRNWVQVCLMGECSEELIAPLLDVLQQSGPVPAKEGI